MRVIVWHKYYGCDTGCCGHYFILDKNSNIGDEFGWDDIWDDFEEAEFDFDHPYEYKWRGNYRAWAEKIVKEMFGEEHVKDLDWDKCSVSDE